VGEPAVGSARADVRDALAGLGYGPDEVAAVLRDLPDGADTSTLLREALQRLAVS
jgi:Holliday junction DNA helicase RuvA